MVWTRLNSMAGPFERSILSERNDRPAVLPIAPDGTQIVGELRKRAEIRLALSLSVIIGATRRAQAQFARNARELQVLLRRVAAGHDLDAGAAAVPELREKRMQLGLGKLIATRVCDHRDPAACADPAHRVGERGPLMRDIARLAFHEVALKHALYVRCPARLHQVTREVRAADEAWVLGVNSRPREAVWNTGSVERFAHFLRPFCATFPDRFEAGPQDRVSRVDLQTDDVNRASFPGHRDLDAVDEADSPRLGLCARFDESGYVVVIGEREHLHSVRCGPRDELAGLQQSVGSRRVTMKIDIHRGILPEKLLDHLGDTLGLVVMEHMTRFGDDTFGQLPETRLARGEILSRELQKLRRLRLGAGNPEHGRGDVAPAGLGFLEAVEHRIHELVRRIARELHAALLLRAPVP